MDKKVKKTLMNAVVNGTTKNVQNLFNQHKLEPDDSFFDYELLKAAIRRNHQTIINFLLRLGCRVVNPNKSNLEETPLHLAMKRNDVYDPILSRLIRQGASVYDKNLNGETPMQAAFKKGYNDAVRTVLRDSTSNNLNPTNNDDVLHFHIACVLNMSHAVKEYLKCGFDPNSSFSIDSEEYTGINPIQFAIKKNYSELFIMLIQYGGNLSIKNTKDLTPLHMIFYSGLKNNGKSLIKEAFTKGNETKFINSKDKYGVTHFHLCCMLDEPDFVKAFIDMGVNVNNSVSPKCLHPGYTPLHFAVHYECEKVIKLLLKHGADPNKIDKRGRTPLHLGIQKSEKLRKSIITMLLEHGANVLITDKKGCTPLHKTFYYRNCEEMQVFDKLISKAQWSATDNHTDEQGLSLFHIACATGNINQVKEFLNSEVNIDSCLSSGIYSGFSALHFAVMNNHKDVVKVLLKRKAKVNVKASDLNISPLHLAVEFNYMKFDRIESMYNWVRFNYNPVDFELTSSRMNQLEIIKLLLSYGADVGATDYLGRTPLLYAGTIHENYLKLDWTCFSYSSPQERDILIKEVGIRLKEIIEVLIENKADVKSLTLDQSTLLHIISKYNSLKISDNLMKLLVISGVDVNSVDIAGSTALYVAVTNVNRKLVRSLLKYNANSNITNKYCITPLHTAIEKLIKKYHHNTNEKDIFCALVESDSNVTLNMSYQDGETMLHKAIKRYNHFITEKLLHYGADINKEDLSGNSSIKYLDDWKTEENFMVHLYGQVFQVVFIHVKKLQALGLPVNPKVLNSCNFLYPIYKRGIVTASLEDYGNHDDLRDLDDIFDNCLKELDKMKNVKIDSYTSFYDILLKDPHDVAKHVKNDILIKVLKNGKVDNNFPLYGFLIRLQFKKGSLRSNVLQNAETALRIILKVNLPDVCYNFILKYLTNEDIENLKEAVPTKRNLKRKLRDTISSETESAPKLQKREKQGEREVRLKLTRRFN